jgi:hypothetical protein
MATTVAQVRELIVEILNESDPGSAFGSISGERYKSDEITRAILLTDAAIVGSICADIDNGRRIGYLTTASGVANGAILTTMIGPVESVLFVVTGGSMAGTHPGEEKPLSYSKALSQENRNPQGLTLIDPLYILDGKVIYHNGAAIVAGGASGVSVNVVYCAFTFNASATSIQSPDEAARAVAFGALSILFPKDGHKVSAGDSFEGKYRSELRGLGINPAELPQAA